MVCVPSFQIVYIFLLIHACLTASIMNGLSLTFFLFLFYPYVRSLSIDNIKDGYYIAPAFMDKLVVHIAKNFMELPNIKVTHITRTSTTFSIYTHNRLLT